MIVSGGWTRNTTLGTAIASGVSSKTGTGSTFVMSESPTITTPTFSGTANGDISGSSGSCTGNATTSSSCSGNAATATALQNSRTINGVSFNGTANITLNFAPNFESAEQTWTASTDTAFAHGLGSTPRSVEGVLRCKTAEFGYAIGDEVPYFFFEFDTVNWGGHFLYSNATNVGFVTGGRGPVLPNRTGGSVGAPQAITTANWKVVLRAWT